MVSYSFDLATCVVVCMCGAPLGPGDRGSVAVDPWCVLPTSECPSEDGGAAFSTTAPAVGSSMARRRNLQISAFSTMCGALRTPFGALRTAFALRTPFGPLATPFGAL